MCVAVVYNTGMRSYPHVEDYIEILAGYNPGSRQFQLLPVAPSFVNLARYDVSVLESIATATMFGTALTDRQAELAIHLVGKYRRQLAKRGIDVGVVDKLPFRQPLRKIDRSKTIVLHMGKIEVRFPYDNELIKAMQEFRKYGQGHTEYYREDKTWRFHVTEFAVNWLNTWGTQHGFDMDPQLQELQRQILTVEQQPHAIELQATGTGYEIVNADISLLEYVNAHGGGFGPSNLLRLVDLAGTLGYTVHAQVLQQVPQCLQQLGPAHDSYVTPTANNWRMILDYARLINRYPVCVYNPSRDALDLSEFASEEIVEYDHNGKCHSDFDITCVKIVHAQKLPQHWCHAVPMLLTTREMMYGGRKSVWTRQAEKIVYLTNTKLKEQQWPRPD